eukprot:symbB.v1.2.036169.t1/scaffold5043.1/size31561/5
MATSMPYQQKILEHFRAALPETTDLTEGQVRILLNHLGIELSEERLRKLMAAASDESGKVTCERFISWMFGCDEKAKQAEVEKGQVQQPTNSHAPEPKPEAKGVSETNRSVHMVETSVQAQLRQILEQHPYAEPGGAASRHPAQPFVENCLKCLELGKYEQAQEELRRTRSVIETAKEFWFPSGIQTSLTFSVGTTTSQNKRVSKCRRRFSIAKVKDPKCSLVAEGGTGPRRLRKGEQLRTFWQSGSQGFFYLDEAAVPIQRLTPTGSASGKCLEPLVLVCDSNAWTPDPRYHFSLQTASQGPARHQLRLNLAKSLETDARGNALPVSWQFAYVPLSFQIISVREQWSWRIVPEANGSSWHSGNILRPRAATRALVAEGEVEDLHGRDFHILEPHDTVVLITVELWKARAEDQQRGVRRFVKYLGMQLNQVERDMDFAFFFDSFAEASAEAGSEVAGAWRRTRSQQESGLGGLVCINHLLLMSQHILAQVSPRQNCCDFFFQTGASSRSRRLISKMAEEIVRQWRQLNQVERDLDFAFFFDSFAEASAEAGSEVAGAWRRTRSQQESGLGGRVIDLCKREAEMQQQAASRKRPLKPSEPAVPPSFAQKLRSLKTVQPQPTSKYSPLAQANVDFGPILFDVMMNASTIRPGPRDTQAEVRDAIRPLVVSLLSSTETATLQRVKSTWSEFREYFELRNKDLHDLSAIEVAGFLAQNKAPSRSMQALQWMKSNLMLQGPLDLC